LTLHRVRKTPSQASGYGSSTEIKLASQEIEHEANWLARQLLDSITEAPPESEEWESSQVTWQINAKNQKLTQPALKITKPQALNVVPGKANDEIIRKRASRRREPVDPGQGPQLGGAMGVGDPQVKGGICPRCRGIKGETCTCPNVNNGDEE
jgi:hypothetical protein